MFLFVLIRVTQVVFFIFVVIRKKPSPEFCLETNYFKSNKIKLFVWTISMKCIDMECKYVWGGPVRVFLCKGFVFIKKNNET